MKLLKLIAWISTAVAAAIILTGGISLVMKSSLFGIHQAVNFFHAANSFLLLAIALLMLSKNSGHGNK